MKGVILAAGKGTRMLPLTKDKQKVLIEVAGKAFIEYVLQSLRKGGIDEIAIITNYREEDIKEYIKENNLDIQILHQNETKGTGDAIMTARPFTNDENFVVAMGDNLYSYEDVKRIANNDDYWYLLCKKHEHPEKYGVLVLDEKGFIKKILEKPIKPPINMINLALYKFCPDVYEKLERTKLSERGEIEVTDAFNMAFAENKGKAIITEHWADFGSPEDIKKIENIIAKGNFPL